MTDQTSSSTVYSISPNLGAKMLLIVTPSTTAASDTIDVSKTNPSLKTIYGVELRIADGGASSASTSWSSTTITIPTTEATGSKYLLVWGAD